MPLAKSDDLQIAQHTLRISDPEGSLSFYEAKLGMTLLTQRMNNTATHFYLGFREPDSATAGEEPNLADWQQHSFLELVYDPEQSPPDIRRQPDSSEGYWKIAISVADVDIAHSLLVSNGVEVDTPRQVPDIAYLCHCNDPDDYCVELIQHDFLHNHTPRTASSVYPLGTRPTFSLITYRVKNVEKSLKFYSDVLGMRLLSRQVVESRGFTLYFLACTNEDPPHPDIENIDNREWLWQRPYTMIELQHIWGTESDDDFAYRVGPETGFAGVSFATRKLNNWLETASQKGLTVDADNVDPILRARTATVTDPDGYSLRLIDKG